MTFPWSSDYAKIKGDRSLLALCLRPLDPLALRSLSVLCLGAFNFWNLSIGGF